jgi:hypothetical protein
MLMRVSWYRRFAMSFFSFDSVNSFFRVYYLPPAAAKEKKNLCGHPTPRQRTPSSALLLCLYVVDGSEWKKGGFGDTSSPGKGLRPLHS